MARQDRIALGKVVLHQRERLLALEPRDRGMLAYSLRTYDEVRDPAEIFAAIPDAKPVAQMIEIAEKIIEQLRGPFDPTSFTDRYEDALKALVAAKEKGAGRMVQVEEPQDTTVSDLMDQLRRSLGQTGGGRRPARAAASDKPTRRKPASATRRRAS
jgi:DNA end-binding protein Ku